MSDQPTVPPSPAAGEPAQAGTAASAAPAGEEGRAFNEKLQAMGKALLSSLYMLVRSVKLYDPENAVFQKPLAALQETVNAIIHRDGKVELQGVKDTFYLNGMLLRLDAASLDNMRALIAEMQAKDVGGLTMSKPVSIEELRNFIFVFAKGQSQDVEEDGVAGRKLTQIRVSRWSKIREKLSKDEQNLNDDFKVDRKKYAMTVYARAIVFIRKYVEQLAEGKQPSVAAASRLVQDLVDVVFEQRNNLLGMTSRGNETEYIIFHHVNTALICLVFGNELGLSKQQLRELGLVALFHEIAMAALPKGLLDKPTAHTPSERGLIALVPFETIKLVLLEKSLGKPALQRIASVYEYRQDWGKRVKGPDGVERIEPARPLKLYSRILALCSAYDMLTSKRAQREAYGPEIALNLMWNTMAHKFDPELLKAFAKVMAMQPTQVLSKKQSNLNISGV